MGICLVIFSMYWVGGSKVLYHGPTGCWTGLTTVLFCLAKIGVSALAFTTAVGRPRPYWAPVSAPPRQAGREQAGLRPAPDEDRRQMTLVVQLLCQQAQIRQLTAELLYTP